MNIILDYYMNIGTEYYIVQSCKCNWYSALAIFINIRTITTLLYSKSLKMMRESFYPVNVL